MREFQRKIINTTCAGAPKKLSFFKPFSIPEKNEKLDF